MMNRRTFLKILGVTVAGTAIGLPKFVEAKDEKDVALIREIIYHHAGTDLFRVRWDVFNGVEQIGVDAEVNNPNERDKYAPQMWMVLSNEMRYRGWKLEDLKPLVLPKGVVSRMIPCEGGLA